MAISREEINDIATKVADEVMGRLREREPAGLVVHVLEHEATGQGRVINPARARATPCKCFEFEGEKYAWSPGVLGLISSKKNPEQYKEFCALGCEPAGAGAAKRFREIKGAIGAAHREWQEKGDGLPDWWRQVGIKLQEKGIEL